MNDDLLDDPLFAPPTVEQQAKFDADRRGIERTSTELLAAGWPSALIKALFDEFGYRCRLRTGETVDFHSAEKLSAGWARLNGAKGTGAVLTRGLEVRVADIVWIADDAGWS